MASRSSFFGSGPNTGTYRSRPVPANKEDLTVYINDELLNLGGKLNNIIEGGVFPPAAEMPTRFKEGMTIYFTQAMPNTEVNAPGIWLYRNDKWWKMVDDPTALNQTLTVYRVMPGEEVPPTPPINKWEESDLNGWSYSPVSSNTNIKQWMSVATLAKIGEDASVNWSSPIPFNNQGDIGETGAEGPAGETGAGGAGHYYHEEPKWEGNWPDTATADTWLRNAAGRPVTTGDILTVTLLGAAGVASEPKPASRTKSVGGLWVVVKELIDGDNIIINTIKGSSLAGSPFYTYANPLTYQLKINELDTTAYATAFSYTIPADDYNVRTLVIDPCVISGGKVTSSSGNIGVIDAKFKVSTESTMLNSIIQRTEALFTPKTDGTVAVIGSSIGGAVYEIPRGASVRIDLLFKLGTEWGDTLSYVTLNAMPMSVSVKSEGYEITATSLS